MQTILPVFLPRRLRPWDRHERFELEDCLIEVLHNAHEQPSVASV